jgi:predicted metal-dependent hydrolase
MTWFNFMLPRSQPSLAENFLLVRGRKIPLCMIRNRRARRYMLRLRPDGSARLTIPRRGSLLEGKRFAERNSDWLARQLEALWSNPPKPKVWLVGTEILFRGEAVRIEPVTDGATGLIRFGSETVAVANLIGDLRPTIRKYLWKLAAAEFPPIVFKFAAAQSLTVRRVTVRNQRSRWGSCSRRGTISLNWKLIQTPPFVRDYVILHELMHLRQMNHSSRFWREMERVCPGHEAAEKWLKQYSALLQ